MTEQKITRGEDFQRFIEGLREGDVLRLEVNYDSFNCYHRPDDPSRPYMDTLWFETSYTKWRYHAYYYNSMMRFFVGGALRLRGLALTTFKPGCYLQGGWHGRGYWLPDEKDLEWLCKRRDELDASELKKNSLLREILSCGLEYTVIKLESKDPAPSTT